jgi:hypothetical protein
MELNRGGVGVPLHKLASVVDEAQKFFRMLGEDVHIGKDSGVWLGCDFDNKSLNFTAEYVGPIQPAQIREFYAAFDGVTLLRRATIAQFARIADSIEEDELIGFGLYQDDQETEPSEWRSLSKREALRITEEIRLLLDRTGDSDVESRIPAALDVSHAAASPFRDRREQGALAERMARLENEVTRHSEEIQVLRGNTANTEKNLQNLLVAVDAFCDRAARQMEKLPPPATDPQESRAFSWRIPATVVAVCALGGVALFFGYVEPRSSGSHVQAADPAPQKVVAPARETPAPAPVREAVPTAARVEPARPALAPAGALLRIDLKANEATWVSIYENDKLTFAKVIEPGQSKTIESSAKIRLQLGNAGGVELAVNGKPVGALGRKGQVRIGEVTADGFHPLEAKSKTPL